MSLPEPEAGLVIRYAYLWKSEHDQGREEGVKDRPCAIVLAATASDDSTKVTVLPVTHTPPADPRLAIEIPAITKRRLGLDDKQSWIIVSEGNEFVWPGPDLRPRPGQDLASVSHGFLPPNLFREVLARFLACAKAGRAARISRTE
jgi:hypothetical protein